VPLIDPVVAEAYLPLMNAVEFTAELTESGVLRIPADVVAQAPKAGRARIIVRTDDQAEDADWRLGAYAQFLGKSRYDEPVLAKTTTEEKL